MDAKDIEDLLKNFELVGSFEGEVDELYEPPCEVGLENTARIIFKTKDGQQFVRLFPIKRLEAIDAAFPLAKVRYEIYSKGQYNVSVMRYAGKSKKELMNEPLSYISDEAIRELDGDYSGMKDNLGMPVFDGFETKNKE